jgi:hypothetical protein
MPERCDRRLQRMLVPKSACSVRFPGRLLCLATLPVNSGIYYGWQCGVHFAGPSTSIYLITGFVLPDGKQLRLEIQRRVALLAALARLLV